MGEGTVCFQDNKCLLMGCGLHRPECQIELSALIGWPQSLSQKGEELAREPDGLFPNYLPGILKGQEVRY